MSTASAFPGTSPSITGAALLALCTGFGAPSLAIAQSANNAAQRWTAVEQALGRKGVEQPGGVIRFSFPRSDLHVTVNGLPVRPGFALGSWVAFKRVGGGHALAMGDLVLTEDEVSAVVARLQEGGVEQTALHNHLLHESPRVMYMHIHAHADPVRIAEAVHAALASTKTPLDTGASASAAPGATAELDTAAIARALGRSGKLAGGVYQVSVPRRATIRDGGEVIPPSMGVATGINFQPTGSGQAAITGDFVMIASEVNPVIRALHASGIEITALHSHMLTEQPRLFFMHFWANDDAVKLATGLNAALAKMAVAPPARARTK